MYGTTKQQLIIIPEVCCGITIGYEVKFTRAIRYRALRDQWLQAVFIISLLINLAAIGLMCWKIYRVSKSVSDLSPAANILYKHTFQVFIEGGALYAVAIIVSLSLHAANLLAAALIVDYLIPHVIGLVPTLIVLRLLVQRTSQSRRASGHDTAPPISQQKTLTQPMFAQATVGDTTGVSEFGRSIHVQAHPTACSDESKWTRNDKVVPSTVCSTEHSK
ncbi:hypothetical protein FRC03_011564 [Tulasnella sp. 419]|nr:hypothetical protein FRC03_011564 [Tulasnella sp. 419]